MITIRITLSFYLESEGGTVGIYRFNKRRFLKPILIPNMVYIANADTKSAGIGNRDFSEFFVNHYAAATVKISMDQSVRETFPQRSADRRMWQRSMCLSDASSS